MSEDEIKRGFFKTFFKHWLPCLCAAALIALSLWRGVQSTAGFRWPYEWDALRDIGIAQSILDGRYPEDPIFLGKTMWYNPLTGALIAAGSWLTGLEPMRMSLVLGPYANLLTPITFFIFVAVLFDSWIALGALIIVLFGRPIDPVRTATCYAPWLLAPTFSQTFFFGALTLYWIAYRRNASLLYLGAGALLGAAFMGHTGAALGAGGTMLCVTIERCWLVYRSERTLQPLHRILAPFGLLLLTAFLVSLPFSYPILRDYQFRVLNPWPSLFATTILELEHLPKFLWNAVSWINVTAAIGFAALMAGSRKGPEKRLVLYWWLVGLAFLIQHYIFQYLLKHHIVLSGLMPGHHALILLSGAKAVWFGAGLAAMAQGVVLLCRRLARRPRTLVPMDGIPGQLVYLSLTLGVCGLLYPTASQWLDFNYHKTRPFYVQAFENYERVFQWIRQNSAPTDVYLCEDTPGVRAVMPAGRKVVATMILYSNPYVDCQINIHERGLLFQALRAGDEATFRKYAEVYHLTHVLLEGEEAQRVKAARLPFLTLVFEDGPVCIFRLNR